MSFVSKLSDEYRQRCEAIAAGWRAEFEPEGYQETRLVDILIQNDWLLVSGPPVDALALPTRMQQSSSGCSKPKRRCAAGRATGRISKASNARRQERNGRFTGPGMLCKDYERN